MAAKEYTERELYRMQQDAVDRVREMQNRSSQDSGFGRFNPPPGYISPNFRNWSTDPGIPRRSRRQPETGDGQAAGQPVAQQEAFVAAQAQPGRQQAQRQNPLAFRSPQPRQNGPQQQNRAQAAAQQPPPEVFVPEIDIPDLGGEAFAAPVPEAPGLQEEFAAAPPPAPPPPQAEAAGLPGQEAPPLPPLGEAEKTTLIQDILGGIGLDDDRLLIIGLLFILINAKADTTLILALIYLLV